jgi:hypothetical protein
MNIGYFSTVGGSKYLLGGLIFVLIQSVMLISLSLYKVGKKRQDNFEIHLLEQGINPLQDVHSQSAKRLLDDKNEAVPQI